MHPYRRLGQCLAVAGLMAACTRQGGQPSDSTARDSSGVASSAPTTDTTARSVGSNEPPPTDKVVGSPGRASSAGEARVTGGPQRAPTPPRNSGCGGVFVNVTVKSSAIADASLEKVASDVLAPVRSEVGAPSLSPAIRAFRVAVRDATAADRVVSRLRSSPQVESVERDACEAVTRQ
jgi:hypothetical protein